MTYKQIFDKFMIEYDKATVTTSYPSLTTDELAVILDKAYLALIALKFTGNNARRSAFETDIKSVSDLQPLIVNTTLTSATKTNIKNLFKFDNADDFLYYVDAILRKDTTTQYVFPSTPVITGNLYVISSSPGMLWIANHDVLLYSITKQYSQGDFCFSQDSQYVLKCISTTAGAFDPSCWEELTDVQDMIDNGIFLVYVGIRYSNIPLRLTTHKQAENFFYTEVNDPWIKYPICFLQDNIFYVVVDSRKLSDEYTDKPYTTSNMLVSLNYIKFPDSFKDHENDDTNSIEINDQLTEELISIAVMLALENVESPRLNAKIQTKGLES